jgi:hypothetical protein
MSRSRFAGFLLEQDDPRQARALVERAWRPRYAGVLPPQVWAEMTFALARARWETEPSRDERARARQLAAQAVAAYEEAGDQYAGSIGQIRDWLGTGGR